MNPLHMNPFEILSNLHGPAYIAFYLLAVFMATMVAYMVRHYLLDRDKLAGQYSEHELAPLAAALDPYDVAYLLGGSERVLTAALASLSARKVIEIGSSQVALKQDAASASRDAHPIELDIIRKLARGPVSGNQLRAGLGYFCSSIERKLAGPELDLMAGRGTADPSKTIPWLIFLAFAEGLSVPRIFFHDPGRPVGFLVLGAWMFFFASFFWFKGPALKGRGQALLKYLERINDSLRIQNDTNPGSLGYRESALAFALFGSVMMMGDPFQQARSVLSYSTGSSCSSSSGCGSSCGSSCGGGCGGGCGG